MGPLPCECLNNTFRPQKIWLDSYRKIPIFYIYMDLVEIFLNSKRNAIAKWEIDQTAMKASNCSYGNAATNSDIRKIWIFIHTRTINRPKENL